MDVIFGADAIRYPLTGIGRYAYELAKGLKGCDEVESLRFMVGTNICGDIPAIGIDAGRGEAVRSWRLFVLKSRLAVAIHRAKSQILQRAALRNDQDALYHGPNYYLPPHSGRCVSTFHDLSFFKFPEFHPPERIRYMDKELPLALQRASVLITDSEYGRSELIEYSGFSEERVLAVPLAASEEFHPRDVASCASVLARYGLRYQGYCLFAGTVEPRKNLARLLDAYSMLPEATRLHYPLVVAGYRGWNSADLHERFQAAQAAGWARYLGYVPSDDLPVLFAGAHVFAFPSIYEGFGLPVLEAMQSGVPLVCSNSSSLPEVVGDCALMCEPEDVDKLRYLLERAIADQSWRSSAILSGHERARQFSWDKTLTCTLAAYRLALSN